ncbi:MAG: Hsp33 family molecular chaperone HslO [Clostridiales bacterium]|jgi:molecular chaperone Hsp33|nr:Hsp33 family molecular chaperone HslO [Clostridiales bacterium]
MIDKSDVLIRGLLLDKNVNVLAINGKQMVQKAHELHDLSRVCTAALGRTLLQTAMMSTQLKSQKDRLTNILAGGGEAGNIVCSAQPNGVVKGYVENPQVELPLSPDGKLDVALAVGWFGTLTVVRDMALREPYVGKIDITSGEIAEDFTNYYFKSEQQPNVIYLGVRIDPQSGDVLSAGGLMLLPLPNCPDDVLDKLQDAVPNFQNLSKMLESMTLESALAQLFEGMDFEKTEELQPRFECDCSRERLVSVLIALGKEELLDMAQTDKSAELHCRFCNQTYRFSEEELYMILKEMEQVNGENPS